MRYRAEFRGHYTELGAQQSIVMYGVPGTPGTPRGASEPRDPQFGPDERVPLTRGEVAPFFGPAIPDPLAVRADGPV